MSPPTDDDARRIAAIARLAAENRRLRTIVNALGAFAGAFLDCYRESDMRPEDRCHDLYDAAVHAHSLALNAGGTQS